MNLLENILIVDFSQFLSGPSASLALADMGAEVIKIEKPETGDICRDLYVSDVVVDGESSIFHAINRNKKSYVADLKCPHDVLKIKELLRSADVMIHNFRPGVMERLGFDYQTIKEINPKIIYASISGYGEEGSWASLPGQDLLLQSVSGLCWLNHNAATQPTPMGVSVVDILAGGHLVQGILALLYQRENLGEGGKIQVSMLETALDFQYELLTVYYNDGKKLPNRSKLNNAHPYLPAPYGIYNTKEGYLALATTDMDQLSTILGCKKLQQAIGAKDSFEKRDEIKAYLAKYLMTHTASYWMELLEPAGVGCSKVYDYQQLTQEEGYETLNMEITITTSNGISLKTTRAPYRVDGQLLTNNQGAPALGEHNHLIDEKYKLKETVGTDEEWVL